MFHLSDVDPGVQKVDKKALPTLTMRGVQNTSQQINKHTLLLINLKIFINLCVPGTVRVGTIRFRTRRQKEQVFSSKWWGGRKTYNIQKCASLSAVMEDLGDPVLVRNVFSLFSIFFTLKVGKDILFLGHILTLY